MWQRDRRPSITPRFTRSCRLVQWRLPLPLRSCTSLQRRVPSGMFVPVPRQVSTTTAPAAAPRESDSAVARTPARAAPIETTSAAEFEAALARALAVWRPRPPRDSPLLAVVDI